MGDYENILNTAREEAEKVGWTEGHAKGREEGRREGRDEGKKEERLQIAEKMLAAGIPISKIVEITGLRQEEFL